MQAYDRQSQYSTTSGPPLRAAAIRPRSVNRRPHGHPFHQRVNDHLRALERKAT